MNLEDYNKFIFLLEPQIMSNSKMHLKAYTNQEEKP
ncbi:hypothetical protein SAMN05216556_10747 [Aequorivita viscosa]|nr:hypothetical protein SAMN05216556_10747 [Aequorivita viscosa]